MCQRHYRQFKSELDSFETPNEAARYEQRLLADGWIERKKKGGRPTDWSPFADIAEQVKSEAAPDGADEDAQRDAERQAILAAETEAAYARKMAEKKNDRSDKRKRG